MGSMNIDWSLMTWESMMASIDGQGLANIMVPTIILLIAIACFRATD